MLGWKQLPIALVPDGGSCGGEWSGSATLDSPTGVTLSYSVQCNSYFGQAYPDDPSDPLLVNWTANHPVGHKAPGTAGFRDPSTAWKGADGVWRQLLACNGAACIYNSTDFSSWNYVGHVVGSGKGATYEMPDMFPLLGADGSYFVKVGMENGTDYWSTGTFDELTNVLTPTAGIGSLGSLNASWDNRLDMQRCDYGSFYSSKSFADLTPGVVRKLIGWVGEESGSPLLQWAGIQSIPREVTADPENPGRVLFNPLAALTSLRGPKSTVSLQTLRPGAFIKLGGSGNQLDIVANFTGPFRSGQQFGVIVLASEPPGDDRTAMTSVVVSVVSATEGLLSIGPHHGKFPLPKSTVLELRVIVDHSVVEAFAASGRAVITRRVYPGPTATASYVVNSGSGPVTLSSLEAYEVNSPTTPTVTELLQHTA